MSQPKYKKSDNCVLCGKQLFNGERDGNCICIFCEDEIKNELYDLLREKSKYGGRIKEISLTTYSKWGRSNKNTTIKIGYDYGRNIYVVLSTSKILEVRELQNEDLLFKYLETEIDIEYMIQSNKIEQEYLLSATVLDEEYEHNKGE